MWRRLEDLKSDKKELEITVREQQRKKLITKILMVPVLVIFIYEHLFI
jgi:hypothetical protein